MAPIGSEVAEAEAEVGAEACAAAVRETAEKSSKVP